MSEFLTKLRFFLLCGLAIFSLGINAHADEKIIYSRLTDGYWQIWSMNIDGRNAKQMTTSLFDKRDPDWFEGGRKLGFRTSNGQLFVMDMSGQNEQEILAQYVSINNPRFSKLNKEVVFVRFDPRLVDKGNIWRSDFEAENPRILTRGVMLRYSPNFSLDGSKIVFVEADGGNKAHHLWIMDRDGGGMEQITFGKKGFDNVPVFSPDGKFVYFSSNREDQDYEIYKVNISTKEITRITHAPGLDTHPSISSDGNKIVFVSNRGGKEQIWMMDVSGENQELITRDDSESIDPVWMP